MDTKSLHTIFTDIVRIPSPSGQEKEVTDHLVKTFEGLGWKVWIDDSGAKNESNTGNVYAYMELDPSYETYVFCAHIDTVQNFGDEIHPIFEKGVFKTDGSTILGADNKASVAALVKTAKTLDTHTLKRNLLFFFPTREEAGVMGSSFFTFDKTTIKYVFNVDGGDVLGSYFYKAMGYVNFEIVVHGIAAHAGITYEKGKNAIEIAGHLITSLPQGRNTEEGWTLNVGTITGGTKVNQVCDKVVMKGEMRFFELSSLDSLKKNLELITKEVAIKFNTAIEVVIDETSYIPPFISKKNSNIGKLFESVANKLGIPPEAKISFGINDSSFFSGKGYEVITISRGGKNAHGKNEEISLDDLVGTAKIIQGLIYS